jgi:cell division protein FtsB
MSPGLQKLILSACSCLLAAVVVAFAFVLHQAYQEHRIFQQRETAYARQVQELKQQVEAKEAYADRLKNDPEFLERVVRERLGYSSPNDLLYKFPEN